jgi:hypothetical protein
MSWYCAAPGCRNRGVWRDEDTSLRYCDHHTNDVDDAAEKRADFAAEYARDAAREAGRS